MGGRRIRLQEIPFEFGDPVRRRHVVEVPFNERYPADIVLKTMNILVAPADANLGLENFCIIGFGWISPRYGVRQRFPARCRSCN